MKRRLCLRDCSARRMQPTEAQKVVPALQLTSVHLVPKDPGRFRVALHLLVDVAQLQTNVANQVQCRLLTSSY